MGFAYSTENPYLNTATLDFSIAAFYASSSHSAADCEASLLRKQQFQIQSCTAT
jgi:hypothetical protein